MLNHHQMILQCSEQGTRRNTLISEIGTIEGSALARLHFYRVDASYKRIAANIIIAVASISSLKSFHVWAQTNDETYYCQYLDYPPTAPGEDLTGPTLTCTCSSSGSGQWINCRPITAASNTSPEAQGINNGRGEILIEDFSNPQLFWTVQNDPVMGGVSTGSMEINYEENAAVFTAEVNNVPSLNAPGFVSMRTRSSGGTYPDVSSCDGLKLSVKQQVPSGEEPYSGYKITFGNARAPGGWTFARGYRADLNVPVGSYGDVYIPFNDFSVKWSDKTGNQITSCQENAAFCPDQATLQDMKTMRISGMGIAGSVRLHIRSIHATGCGIGGGERRTSDTDNTIDSGSSALPDEMESEAFGTCAAGTGALRSDGEIYIEQFSNPSFSWNTFNDPVMGGASTSSFQIANGTAIFEGNVADIPFLGLPGFITMTTWGFSGYPDVSCCEALTMTVMTAEEYSGYRVSFGMAKAEDARYAIGYKADFFAPVGEFGDVTVPFDGFSVKWDEATGDQIVTCQEDPAVCPDIETLRNMRTIALWGEGVGGNLKLQVTSIRATGCSKEVETPDEVRIGTALSYGHEAASSSRSLIAGLVFLIVLTAFN